MRSVLIAAFLMFSSPVSADEAVPKNFEPAVRIERTHCSKFYPIAGPRPLKAGSIDLKYSIGVDGAVRDVVIVKSSGDPLMDDAARSCVEQGRFRPATANGVPVEQHSELHFDFGGPH